MNDADAIKFLEQSVNKILPPNHFHLMDEPAMVGEDFGYITKLVPSAFMWVGVHKENTPSYSLHSPHFYYDEKDLLPTSVKLFAQVALDYLS
jgi:metal-dependent amidase/aminoacylase/carboxypeptidase family protein